jgi:hypothetical protein
MRHMSVADSYLDRKPVELTFCWSSDAGLVIETTPGVSDGRRSHVACGLGALAYAVQGQVSSQATWGARVVFERLRAKRRRRRPLAYPHDAIGGRVERGHA